MGNFTIVTEYLFQFSPHHLHVLVNINHTLNNTYSEQFEDNAVTALYSDVGNNNVDANGITTIWTTIVDRIVPTSQSR